MDPKELAEFDQNLKTFEDTIPGIWRSIYLGSIKRGFTETQSFLLVQTYILASGTGGVSFPEEPNTPGQNPDESC